jgi:hypothetical protein
MHYFAAMCTHNVDVPPQHCCWELDDILLHHSFPFNVTPLESHATLYSHFIVSPNFLFCLNIYTSVMLYPCFLIFISHHMYCVLGHPREHGIICY